MSVDEQVVGTIWTSKVSHDVLTSLCKIGSRAGLTESEIKGRDYLLAKFKEFRLENVHSEALEYQGWINGETSVEVTRPIKSNVDAISTVQCPSTEANGVEGELIFLGNGALEIFRKREKEIDGKIVMFTSATPREKGRYIHRREKLGMAIDMGAKAFVYMNHVPGMLQRTGSMRTNAIAEIPTVAVSYEEGMRLVELQKQGQVIMRIRTKHETKKAQCWHVMGDIIGAKYPDNIVIVSAHYDSHYISPGAIDNTSGVAAVMEIAHALAPLKGKLKRTIRFLSYPIEEMGLTGSSLFVRAHEKEMQNIDLVINFDVVGLGRKRISVQGFPELVPYCQDFCKETNYPVNVDTELMHNSDHFCFMLMGVPAVYVHESNESQDYFKYILTKADTLDKADPLNVKELAMVSARLAMKVASEEKPVAKHKTEDEIIELLESDGTDKFLKITKMWEKFFPWKH